MTQLIGEFYAKDGLTFRRVGSGIEIRAYSANGHVDGVLLHHWSLTEAEFGSVLTHLSLSAPAPQMPVDKFKCGFCASAATCIGRADGDPQFVPSCDEHCGHSNEDGECFQLVNEDGEYMTLAEMLGRLNESEVELKAAHDALDAGCLEHLRGQKAAPAPAATPAPTHADIERVASNGDALEALRLVREIHSATVSRGSSRPNPYDLEGVHHAAKTRRQL
jgi:hypothetical protein